MTKQQAQSKILTLKVLIVSNWDKEEDAYCISWFGKNYLGNGMIRCDYCKEEAVEFRGYIGNHVCLDCEDSIMRLEGRMS